MYALVAPDRMSTVFVLGKSDMGQTWFPHQRAPCCCDSQNICFWAVRVNGSANIFGFQSVGKRESFFSEHS